MRVYFVEDFSEAFFFAFYSSYICVQDAPWLRMFFLLIGVVSDLYWYGFCVGFACLSVVVVFG